MNGALRSIAVIVLLVAVLGMGVHYATERGEHRRYTGASALVTEYDDHVGERVFIFATVEETHTGSDTATVRIAHGGTERILTVEVFTKDARPGGVVQVYGTVRPDRVIAADEVALVNPAGSSKTYKYGVSAVGALLVVAMFMRHWRVNVPALSFEQR